MKKKLPIYAGMLIALALLFSCEGLFNMISFGTGEYPVPFSIPPMEAGTFTFNDTIESNIKEILEENGITEISLVEKVTLKKATLEILDGEVNFNKITAARILIGGPELVERDMCWKDTIPADTNKFSFSMAEENLMDYVTIDEFWIKCLITLGEDITDTVDFNAIIEYEVTPSSTVVGTGL